jgi:hypothetical protein
MKLPEGLSDILFARVFPLIWIGGAIVGGVTLGAGGFFLLFSGGALLLVILLFWRSTQSLTEESPLSLEEALGLAAPTQEEERKQSVLRILKDLEYERAVGKIEDADYRELSERYRAEARALLSNVEEGLGPARLRAEALLEKRLAKSANKKTGETTTSKAPTDSAESAPTASSQARAVLVDEASSTPETEVAPALNPEGNSPPKLETAKEDT